MYKRRKNNLKLGNKSLLGAVLLGVLLVMGLAFPVTSAYAIGGERAAILMPFENGGKTWLAGDEPGQHHVFWNAWSADLHSTPGTAVKPRVQTADGTVTMSVAAISETCAAPNSAGKNVRVNVSVDGIYAGQVLYGHLDNVQVSVGNSVTTSTTLGYLKLWNQSSCWQDTLADGMVHTHIEVAKGCYRNLNPWTNYSASTAFGLLSSDYTVSHSGSCDENDVNQVLGGGTRPQETTTIPWYFSVLEGDLGSVSGHNANTGLQPAALTFNNQMYVFSYDQTNGNLRQGRTAPSWQFTTLDGDPGSLSGHNADVGRTPAATVYNNSLQLFYYSATSGNLRHAWSSNGTNWSFENLDGDAGSVGHHNADTGKTPAATVHSDGTMQVLYYDQTNKNLRHAWTGSGQGWQFETLDGDAGSISGYSADVGLDPAIVSYGGQLHAFYYDETNKNLRHARTTASGWQFENLDGDAGSICGLNAYVGTNPTVTIHDGFMHVFYYDVTNGNLRHAWSSTTQGWSCETLDGDAGSALGNVGNFGAMTTAASIGGSLQVFAYDSQWGGLRHYWSDATNGWQVENFDGYGGGPAGRVNHQVGHDPALINHGGVPKVFYYDHTQGNLRHAVAQ